MNYCIPLQVVPINTCVLLAFVRQRERERVIERVEETRLCRTRPLYKQPTTTTTIPALAHVGPVKHTHTHNKPSIFFLSLSLCSFFYFFTFFYRYIYYSYYIIYDACNRTVVYTPEQKKKEKEKTAVRVLYQAAATRTTYYYDAYGLPAAAAAAGDNPRRRSSQCIGET